MKKCGNVCCKKMRYSVILSVVKTETRVFTYRFNNRAEQREAHSKKSSIKEKLAS